MDMNLTLRVIIISLLIGASSGVLATALTTSYLSAYALELSNFARPSDFSQESPRVLPQAYEDALVLIQRDVIPAVGTVFSAAIPITGFTQDKSLSPVLALTSDGWMLSRQGSLSSLIDVNESKCVVDKVIPHKKSNMNFLHCSLTNLSVVDIDEGYDLEAGDNVFVIESADQIVFTQVRTTHWSDQSLASSDIPSRRVQLLQTNLVPGSFVFNLSGGLVGVIDSTDATQVIPFEHLSVSFHQVLENAPQLSSATLGVSTISLAHVAGLSEELTRGYRVGALVFGAQAIEKKSAAQKAGLQAGDIILEVDGQLLNDRLTLDDLLVLKDPEEEILLSLDRAGERLEVLVILGSFVQ